MPKRTLRYRRRSTFRRKKTFRKRRAFRKLKRFAKPDGNHVEKCVNSGYIVTNTAAAGTFDGGTLRVAWHAGSIATGNLQSSLHDNADYM